MLTIKYKGWFIHDVFNANPQGVKMPPGYVKTTIQSPDGKQIFRAKTGSIHSAKCLITRKLTPVTTP